MQSQKFFITFAPLFLSLLFYTSNASAQPSIPRDSTWITNGNVYAVAYAKGITYIGGDFSYVGPNTWYGAALNTTTGMPDLKFPRVNGSIFIVTPDGANGWYIGGKFTKVGNFTRNGIAHIQADGTVDPNWNPNATGNLVNYGSPIHAIVVSGSTVYVGGNFTNIGGQPRRGIAALDAATGLATAWNPNASSLVRAIVVNGTTVYLGGDFTSIGGQSRNYLAAIDVTTGGAKAWNPAPNARVNAIVVTDTLVFVAGEFTQAGGQTRNRLAAFGLFSGNVTGWNPNANGTVNALTLSGTMLFAGGEFTSIGGLARLRLAALSIFSSIPLNWNPGTNATVHAIHVNGATVYVGGEFTQIGGQLRYRIAALNAATGNLSSWISHTPGLVYGLATNNTGTVLYAGGAFRSIGGQWRNRLAALDATTGFATAWNPNVNGPVHVITTSGPNVYIGGAFGTVGGTTRNRIAAIDAATGALVNWNPNANDNVHAITISNSTVYVGGKFSNIGGQPRNRLAALNMATGEATAWDPNISVGTVYSILVNGSTVYVAGDFYSVGVQLRQAVAAIDVATGQALAWNPNLNVYSVVYAMALDGSTLYIGGDFSTVKGQTRNKLAAIDVTTADPTAWNPNANGNVRTLVLSGANVYVGGAFTDIGGFTRNYLAAINKTTGIPAGWNPDANGNAPDYGSGQCLAVMGSAVLAGGTFRTMGGDFQDYFAQFGNIVVTNDPPNAATTVNQFKSNGTTVIPEGGTTNEKKVAFKATVSDPDDDQVKLQIELRKTTEAFTGIPTHESSLVNSGTQATIVSDTLAAVSYKWRYRVMDARGLATNWVEFGITGNTDFVVNQLPVSSAVNQFKSNGTSAIPEGAKINENKVVFKGTVSDPDGEQVRLQIELRRLNEPFTGVPNLQSGMVNSGTQVTILRDSLLSVNYKWRYRAIDARELASAWSDFGAPANIDFAVAANKPPISPTALNQLKADGVTAIPEGAVTNENKVVFKATVTDPDSEQVQLQIELRKTTEAYSGIPNLQSGLVNTGAQVTVTRDTLSAGNYKWRCRTMDARGLTSAWTEFGSTGNTDFIVNRLPAIIGVNQFKADGVTAIPEGDTTDQRKIVFKGTIIDPDGEQARLQIELRKISDAFTGVPNLQSSLANSGVLVTIVKDSLFSGDYKWRFRAIDARGLVSPWVEFGTAGKKDFTVQVEPEPPIYPAVAASQASGTEFWIDVKVGDVLNPVTNLFGVSFVLNFTSTEYIDVVTPHANTVIPGSLMGNDVIFYQTVDELAGKVNVGISRKVGQGGVNGEGVVLRVKFLARANTPDTTKALFSITEVKANDPQGSPVKLFPRSKLVTISNKNVIVWPGDTNNDGVVNQADVLAIGLYWGSKGPARPNASLNWSGQPGAAWTPVAATYANANGDTIVNQAEVAAIGLNWGKSHAALFSVASRGLEKVQSPASATIIPEIIPAVEPPDQEFFLRVKVLSVNDLFGLSFELSYDQPQLLQTLAVEPDSLFGPDVVFYSNIDADQGKIAVGISRKAGQTSVSGSGSVVRIKAKIAATATVGTKINFILQSVVANDSKGTAINLMPQSSSLTVGSLSGIESGAETALPASYRLYQNHPNPFKLATLIKYEIPEAGRVLLQVYNLSGQEVMQLVNRIQQPGRYQIDWNGRDHQGRGVPSGVYICRIQAGSFVQTQKMILVR
ncbi:MAG: PQQ-binding-like beta-propeller repeat protein [candidate division KSB1 bacterium]|nr:PQQ-binding-like beta-propeller repeat protein [candidate division KSB1 bacterium]MDZ7304702.1 PQQ-binding-like beta-propeller repeat protein [candidate division KSB1 bacterium]MDZ7311688.1 PQQ-binding-like beta-propeller repeat protein [candidate division KSB1 bacterium]